MNIKSFEVSGVVNVIGVRDILVKGIPYRILDLYIPGEGPATVIIDRNYSLDDVVGFVVSVYQGRLSVRPVVKDGNDSGDK
jgi:hypothetical protein